MTDKAFLRLIVTSAIAVLLCLVCLCSTTWAWFAEDVSNNTNKIQTAKKCLVTVSVTDSSDTPLIDIETGVALTVGETYKVEISLPQDSASGYCLIVVGTKEYYSPYIARHNNDEPITVAFTLTVATTQTVSFISRWGIYASECSVQNGTLHIINV